MILHCQHHDQAPFTIDVMDVRITKAYVGPVFTNDEGASLGICQRDDGWEATFRPMPCDDVTVPCEDIVVQFMHGGARVVGQDRPEPSDGREPWLGLATTEDLFRELIARLSEPLDHEIGARGVARRVGVLAELLGSLPVMVREYRTVVGAS